MRIQDFPEGVPTARVGPLTENCMQLKEFRPRDGPVPGTPRPSMIFIHGGGGRDLEFQQIVIWFEASLIACRFSISVTKDSSCLIVHSFEDKCVNVLKIKIH